MTIRHLTNQLMLLLNHPEPTWAREQAEFLLLEYIANERVTYIYSQISCRPGLEEEG